MIKSIRFFPPAIQEEIERIKNSGKKITDIGTHDYERYVEVHVNGVDSKGWPFCKIISYKINEEGKT